MKANYINFTATRAYAGLLLQKLWLSPIALLVYIVLVLPYVQTFIRYNDSQPLILLLAVILFALHICHTFNRSVLLNDDVEPLPGRNLGHIFSADMVRMLMREKTLTAFTLLRAAISTKRGKFLLTEIGISSSDFMARLQEEVSKQIDVHGFIIRAKEFADSMEEKRLDANSIIYFFFQTGGPFTDLLNERDLSIDDLKNIMQWEKFHHSWERDVHTWSPEKLSRICGSMGRGWVTGYTNELDYLTTNISDSIAHGTHNGVVIHKEEIASAMHVLSRSSQHNVLILGKNGVGKRTLIENVARQLREQERTSARTYTNVLLLHTERLLSGFENPDQYLLRALTSAKSAGNFILVIDNLATILKSQNSNLINVLVQFLNEPNISLMAIANVQDYHVLIKKEIGMDSLFEKVYVNDATTDETMMVLMTHYFRLEERKNLHMTYKALKSIVDLSNRYIGRDGFPGKAVAVMEDSAIAARRRHDTFVTETDVRQMVSLKAHVNVEKLSEDERTRLLHLDEALSSKVIGQDAALRALSNTLKRARLDINAKNKPLGTFLFLGPTGVGKTETAKVLAEEYFGSAESMIRMDMNEFSTESSVHQIVGAPTSGDEHAESFLARRVQDRPFSLILLDEIEKAHPKVLNVFLQILDEGQMTDAMGVKTDFRNTIIIATSNAGALFIRDFVRKNEQLSRDAFKQALIDAILEQNIFSPEFINRFDEVALYYPLSQHDAQQVAMHMIDSVIHDMQTSRGISLKMEEGVVEMVVERGYSQEFGAREMRRVIVNLIENFVADQLLRHDIKRGEEILIRREDITKMLDG